MSRPTFRYDLLATVLATAGMAVLVPEFTQLLLTKTLQGPDWLLPLMVTQLAVGNVAGTLIAQIIQRRRRVPFIVASRMLIGVALAMVAFLPTRAGSSYLFVAMLCAPALLLAVALNVRAGILHSNYPSALRGRIFSRQVIMTAVTMIAAAAGASHLMDRWDGAWRLLYPLAAVCFIASALALRHIRVRRERLLLRQGAGEPFRPLAGLVLLRQDPIYRRFLLWQMFSASMVMMAATPLVLTLTDVFGVNYTSGTAALLLLPFAIKIVATPLIGRVFDSVGPNRFRAIGAVIWASSRAIICAAAMMGNWAGVLIGFAVQGLAMSTGEFAYNISHTRFAPAGKSPLYMGLHMTFQGIRGLFMPFVGLWLYRAPWMGLWVLALAAALQFIAAAGFYFSREPAAQTDN